MYSPPPDPFELPAVDEGDVHLGAEVVRVGAVRHGDQSDRLGATGVAETVSMADGPWEVPLP